MLQYSFLIGLLLDFLSDEVHLREGLNTSLLLAL
jgi:hypothetical protein